MLGTAIMTVISFLVMFLMILGTVYTNKILDNQDYISSILRSYITKMEMKGCLNQAETEALVKDLKEYGMTEIHLYGNFAAGVSNAAIAESYGTADYADYVQLRVKGTMKAKSLKESSGSFLNLTVSGQEYQVDLKQKGIAVR